MKPISTLMKPLRSVDLTTLEEAPAAIERSDVCAVPAAAVVGEAVVCLVLADAVLERFGGDSMRQLHRPRARDDRRSDRGVACRDPRRGRSGHHLLMLRPIVRYGTAVLQQPARDVDAITPEITTLDRRHGRDHVCGARASAWRRRRSASPLRIFVVDLSVGRDPAAARSR